MGKIIVDNLLAITSIKEGVKNLLLPLNMELAFVVTYKSRIMEPK